MGVFVVCIAKLSHASGKNDDPTFTSIADLGFGAIDEDGFIFLLLEQQFSWKDFAIALAGPMRLRAVDRDPSDSGVVREQDWDEASDYARILRNLSFTHEWDDAEVEVRIGELNGVGIGHGSAADAYFGSTDMDHYQGGLEFNCDWAGNGIEFMMENVVAPQILVGRVFLAPLAWFFDGRWPRRLEIGFTLGADIAAPHRILDRADAVIPVTGGDISFRLIDADRFVFMPYFDLMVMDGEKGLHAGSAMRLEMSRRRGLFLHLRGEYRRVGSDYHPAIFNPFYEYNRLFYDVHPAETAPAPTFADHLAGQDPPTRHAFMADGVFEWENKMRLGARYDTEGSGRAHWIMFRFDLFPWKNHSFGLFYAGQDIRGGSGIFDRDALIGLSTRHRIVGPLDLFAEFTRRWRRVEQTMNYANEAVIGFGISFYY